MRASAYIVKFVFARYFLHRMDEDHDFNTDDLS